MTSCLNYTIRQKEGWKKLANNESLDVKSNVVGLDATGQDVSLVVGNFFRANKVKPYKISDHGEIDISNTVISEVPVAKWKNYSYTEK